jgi:arsenate reductase
MSVTIYGIKNCDTMKKARAWLDKHGVAYAFHDYKTAGIERAQLERWAKKSVGRRCSTGQATTFKKLPEKEKDSVRRKGDRPAVKQPSMIKRPVLEAGGGNCWSASSRSSTQQHWAN